MASNSEQNKLSTLSHGPHCTQCSGGYVRLLGNSFPKKAKLSQLVYSDVKLTLFENVFSQLGTHMSKVLKRSKHSTLSSNIFTSLALRCFRVSQFNPKTRSSSVNMHISRTVYHLRITLLMQSNKLFHNQNIFERGLFAKFLKLLFTKKIQLKVTFVWKMFYSISLLWMGRHRCLGFYIHLQ